eukprot:GHVO01000622.1.p1 GENE.GHVO01000622.1~~GHVO01000622.1.p1  ORF type:complete len:103 (-),score=10.75 GHVO01000622.1:130-438(-)
MGDIRREILLFFSCADIPIKTPGGGKGGTGGVGCALMLGMSVKEKKNDLITGQAFGAGLGAHVHADGTSAQDGEAHDQSDASVHAHIHSPANIDTFLAKYAC